MGRGALVLAAVLGLMPEPCAKIIGQEKPAKPFEPPPIVPSATAVPPPTYQAPDPGGPLPSPGPSPVVNADLEKARDAFNKHDYKKVKTLLFTKVKGGKASKEEAALLVDACGNLKDKACIDAAKKAHPELE